MRRLLAQEFLKTQTLAVIATARSSDRGPETALIAFAEDNKLNIYFQTSRHTRKAQNLLLNPQVSFVFGLTLEAGLLSSMKVWLSA